MSTEQPGGPAWSPTIASGPVRFTSHLALHDQRLLADYVRWFLARPGSEAAQSRPASMATPITADEARARIASGAPLPEPGPALARVRAHIPAAITSRAELQLAGDTSLGELVYAVVRQIRPFSVVETGVAQGVTSAYILAGLEDNNLGVLHSIDLPQRSMISQQLVGAAVPQDLRSRWTYHWGPARRLLPPLLGKVGKGMSLFVHDSDHSYANMVWELKTAWAALAPGGWIVCDDAQLHTAVEDVARSVGVDPFYVSQLSKTAWTALFTKPR